MKTATATTFASMPKDYQSLVMMFLPRSIHDKIDYQNTMEVIDILVGHDLTDEQELFLDTLSTLAEVYEDEHYAIETKGLSPVAALRYLMEEHGMTADALGKFLGERTLGSKLLRGQRKIGLKYAKALAGKFAVDVSIFIE